MYLLTATTYTHHQNHSNTFLVEEQARNILPTTAGFLPSTQAFHTTCGGVGQGYSPYHCGLPPIHTSIPHNLWRGRPGIFSLPLGLPLLHSKYSTFKHTHLTYRTPHLFPKCSHNPKSRRLLPRCPKIPDPLLPKNSYITKQNTGQQCHKTAKHSTISQQCLAFQRTALRSGHPLTHKRTLPLNEPSSQAGDILPDRSPRTSIYPARAPYSWSSPPQRPAVHHRLYHIFRHQRFQFINIIRNGPALIEAADIRVLRRTPGGEPRPLSRHESSDNYPVGSIHCREREAGGANGKSLRKPADQRHYPARRVTSCIIPPTCIKPGAVRVAYSPGHGLATTVPFVCILHYEDTTGVAGEASFCQCVEASGCETMPGMFTRAEYEETVFLKGYCNGNGRGTAAEYPRRWIGRGGPAPWPTRSPDLSPTWQQQNYVATARPWPSACTVVQLSLLLRVTRQIERDTRKYVLKIRNFRVGSQETPLIRHTSNHKEEHFQVYCISTSVTTGSLFPGASEIFHIDSLPTAPDYGVAEIIEDVYEANETGEMERRWNEREYPEQNPPASGIVQHDSHKRISGCEPAGDRIRIAVAGGERPSHCATAALNEEYEITRLPAGINGCGKRVILSGIVRHNSHIARRRRRIKIRERRRGKKMGREQIRKVEEQQKREKEEEKQLERYTRSEMDERRTKGTSEKKI
ncbi:hypothetical protein PR048_011587 [Dryococelus australis]|uniref:Uncharacterized protein n=1 Tax=Dryococelus australis TaxID=614101 RepID=A0ABQ9HLZ8_9NEOP|nr:hypothetical protein PR048_011587 [Dryococelus australis]